MTSTPSSARNRILGKVRSSLGVKPGHDPRSDTVEARISRRQRHLSPARATLPPAEQRDLFKGYLTRGTASVIDVPASDGLPAAIAAYLRDHNLPAAIRMGSDARLAGLPWDSAPSIDVRTGRALPSDAVTLSYALAAAAETGTLFLASGADNPVTLSFLPDTHLVALDAGTLVGGYEDAFDIVRSTLAGREMPRTLNLISGPSRTSDIGGKTVMGAHGPRRLAVFVIG